MYAIVRMPLGSPDRLVFAQGVAAGWSDHILRNGPDTVWCVEQRRSGHALVLVFTLVMIFLPCLAWLMGRPADIVAYPLLLGPVAIGARQVFAARSMAGSRLMLALACGCVSGVGYSAEFFTSRTKMHKIAENPRGNTSASRPIKHDRRFSYAGR
jgi:hypothetical protein